MSSTPRCAFDGMADDYDRSFTATGVGRALRGIVWSHLDRVFHGCRSILELGCGTGEDAIHLAGGGARVLALDSSSRMLGIAEAKARRAGCEDLIEFRCIPMEQMSAYLAGRRFDGVLSNFGAVNCVAGLPRLAADVAGRLTPGAPLVWVVMGKYSPWEWVWYLAHGSWRKAVRRLAAGGARWRGMTIHYPTPGQMAAVLEPHFLVHRLSALGGVLPPGFAGGWLERSPRMLAGLTWLEKRAHRMRWLAGLADHYIVEAVRRP